MSAFFNRNVICLLIFSCLMFLGCQEKTVPVEPPTIPEDKMTLMLTDIQLVEGMIQLMLREQKDSLAHSKYESIYRHYNTNEKEFDENLKIYLSDPILADRVYTKVIENLSKMESENKLTKELKVETKNKPLPPKK